MFSFLYRVFYDRSLFSAYVKKGGGFGFKLLFVLTLFVAFSLSLRLFFLFSAFSQKPVDDFIGHFPQIVFEKGQIVSPENKFYSYIPESGRFFFVFDTTKNPVSLKNLPPVGVYLSSDAFMTVHGNEIRRIPFVKLFRQPDFTLDQKDMRAGAEEIVSLSKFIVPLIVFVFCMPGIFCTYVAMMLSGIVLSFLVAGMVKVPLRLAERFRLAVLSSLPAGVINALGFLLGSNIRSGMLGFIITVVYMYCFLKDGSRADKIPDVVER